MKLDDVQLLQCNCGYSTQHAVMMIGHQVNCGKGFTIVTKEDKQQTPEGSKEEGK